MAAAGLDGVKMLLQVHDELVFEVPDGREEEAATVIKSVMGAAAGPGAAARRAARRRSRVGTELGRGALSETERGGVLAETAAASPDADMATLARGGRLNVFGFVLRLAGMLPFLFIGGRIYGPEALGRFAYAVLTVEFAAQIAALGLRRGLAQLLANAKEPQACIVADALLVAASGSAIANGDPASSFRRRCIRRPRSDGLDRLLAITVIAISWTDIALAGLAYHNDVGSTVRARSIVQPWTISIAALALSFVPIMVSRGDGLIIAYVLSMVAALVAALIPLFRCYGLPHGWKPDLGTAWSTAVRNAPLAAADAVEWASRRIDLAVLGAFMPASFVGIYYAAQQVATLPAKLKTSFEPVLGPAIVRRLAVDDRPGIAKQVRQVTYWIIAAQAGIALGARHPGTRGHGTGRVGLYRRHRDARLPARRGSHRRHRGRERGGVDLRRANART